MWVGNFNLFLRTALGLWSGAEFGTQNSKIMIQFIKSTIAQLSNKANFILLRLIFLLSVVFLCGGCSSTDTNTDKAIEWINKAKKPIRAKSNTINGWTYNSRYTLTDADGNVYYCGETSLSLPDTITVWGGEKNY